MPNRSLTLYLAKKDIEDFSDILTLGARNKLDQPSTRTVIAEDFGDGAIVHVFVGDSSIPEWFSELQAKFEIASEITSQSACGVIIFRASGRLFAATFAHAWMYLEESNLETDFGLKVALNALDDTKLKRLERANLADALRGVNLSPFQRDFREFGIEDALDLVRKIGGTTKEASSAESITGARSLRVTGEYDLGDLPQIATEALDFFSATDYRNTSFRVIDVVSMVTDKRLIGTLDGLMIDRIRQQSDSFELSLPVNYDDDDVGYRFIGPNRRKIYPDLLLRNYMSAMGDRLQDFDAHQLNSHKIVATYANEAIPDKRASLRSALVGSIVHGNARYAINEAEWYRIDEAFKQSIEEGYGELLGDWNVPPTPLRKIYDEQGNGKYQREDDYNAEVAEARGLLLLDTILIPIPEAQGSGFEVCDLLDVQRKRLIHVKRSSRRSSVLSHFFKQGANSAKNLSIFPGVVANLLQYVSDTWGNDVRERVQQAFDDVQRKWTVEYWIADAPRASGEFNIPFFSKISLRDEVRIMRAMRFGVEVRFIGLEPEDV